MQCIYNKQYLKELNMQKNYLKRFAWDKASYTLRQDLMKAVCALENEIYCCKRSLERASKQKNEQQLKLF